MGPVCITPDCFGTPKLDARPSGPARARLDDNRFDDYLSEARGADDTRDADDAEPASAADTVDHDKAEADTPPPDGVIAVAPVHPIASLPVPVLDEATGATALNADADLPLPATTAPVARDEAPGPSNVPTPASASTELPQAATSAPQSDGAATEVIDSRTDAQPGVAIRNESFARPLSDIASERITAAQSSGPVASAGQANDAGVTVIPDSKVQGDDAPEWQTVKRAGQGPDEKPALATRESVFDRKVRDAIESRRVEPSKAAANEPASRRSETDARDPGPGGSRSGASRGEFSRTSSHGSAEPVGSIDATGAGAGSEVATIKAGGGDSVAITALRLLVSGPSQDAQSHVATGGDGGAGGVSTVGSGIAVSRGAANTLVNNLIAGGSPDADGVERMARTLQAKGVPGKYEATLRLDPPMMGQVRVRMHMRHEGLTIQVEAQSRASAKLIESRMDELRDSLAAHGIRVERTEVVTRSPATSDAGDHEQAVGGEQQQTPPGNADQEAPRGTFGSGEAGGHDEFNVTGAGDGGGPADDDVLKSEGFGVMDYGISGRAALNVFA